MTQRAFQDEISGNQCWGCGSANENGLQIKSYWSGDEAVCTWQPKAYHNAGPPHVLNGGDYSHSNRLSRRMDCNCGRLQKGGSRDKYGTPYLVRHRISKCQISPPNPNG